MALTALLFVALCIVVIHTAHAEPQERQQATRIETDQKAGVIRFIVDGHEQALLDKDGLHVREDVFYGGSMTDYGRSGFDVTAARDRKP